MQKNKKKRMATIVWLLIPLLILQLLSLTACSDKSINDDIQNSRGSENVREEAMPGGVRDWTDSGAPKAITSKEINSFKCEFNYIYYCVFSITRQEDNVLCVGDIYESNNNIFNFEATAPLETLDELQAIVEEHNFVALNGEARIVDGLPEHQGGKLLIEYASGEEIYAYNNQFSLLSDLQSAALFDFFGELAREAGYDFLGEKEDE